MDQERELKQSERPMPQAVEGLATQVVSLLGTRTAPMIALRVGVLDKLITQVLTRGLFDAGHVASMLRAQRLSDAELINSYIPNAARKLGQMWTDDDLSFADVSIGSARLQALTHEVSSQATMEMGRGAPLNINLLVATSVGEDHTLGAVTLCTLLRRKGHNVDLRLGATTKCLLNDIKANRPDVVMFSCSRPEGLASLTRVIKQLRSQLKRPPVLAIGGVVLDHAADIVDRTEADLVTRDIQQVIKLAVSFRKSQISVVE